MSNSHIGKVTYINLRDPDFGIFETLDNVQ